MLSTLRNLALTGVIALACGFAGAAAWSYSGLADQRTRTYLLDNPEILEELFNALQQQQAVERISTVADDVYAPFPGAIMGNPQGTKVIVEFTDYNCSYCEASLPDLSKLIKENPDLKVVLREIPQFPGSEEAARMALAAAMQGKYLQFHDAMFAASPANAQTAEQVAQQVGLDMDRARRDAASQIVTNELTRNFSLAQTLGFNGTPGWIIGDRWVNGYVGYRQMSDTLKEAGPPIGQ